MTIKLPEAGSRKARVPQYGLIRVISLAVTCILAFFMVGCFLAGLPDWAGVFCAVTLGCVDISFQPYESADKV